MQGVFLLVHVIIALGLIGLVLIQQGKGAEAGAGFAGGGGAQTLFGSQGSGSFLTRVTACLAVGFFITSLVLAHLNSNKSSAVDSLIAPATQEQTEIVEIPEAPKVIPGTDVPVEQ